jgi:hypothetical protein
MNNRKITLSNEQQQRNDEILSRLEAEKRQLWEETRALQRQYRRQIRDQNAEGGGGDMMDEMME